MNDVEKANVAVFESFITGGMQARSFGYFTVYDKDEMSDLTKAQRQLLKEMIKRELEARRRDEKTGKTHAKT